MSIDKREYGVRFSNIEDLTFLLSTVTVKNSREIFRYNF